MVRVDAPAAWKATLSDIGSGLLLQACCPSCSIGQAWNIQAPPWSAPTEAETSLLDTPEGAGRFEERRAAGKIKHRELGSLDFEMWCHRCQVGAPATIVGS